MKRCRHCGREIVPTPYGSWGDADNPEFEVCEMEGPNENSHGPEPEHPTLITTPTRLLPVIEQLLQEIQ